MRYRTTVIVALLAALVLAGPAQAQSYPDRSVKLVTQGAAGSGPDVIARIVTDYLGKLWGQQIVVLNQPGAGGVPAARTAVTAPADGYSLYFAAVSSFIVMPEMFPNLPFDLDRDFTRISLVIEQPMVVAVAPSLGAASLADLIAMAKARPGQILYAANARGAFPHITVERLQKETGAQFTHVPYPGVPQGLQDLAGGRISMIVESVGALSGSIQGGTVKPLAVASQKRLPNYPDLPTVAETVPGFSALGWFALLAPVGTPDAIVRKVNQDLKTVLDMPELQKRFAELGTFARPMSPEETTDYIRAEQRVWRPIVRSLGLSPPS
jgi:tripartite-type tricarboxylate transporter receptor subunit TctC